MSVYMYDNSIVSTLRSITRNNKIYITPPDNVLRTIAQVTGDSAKLPMISLTRTGVTIQNPSHFGKFDGGLVDIDYDNKISHRIQMIPIRINYLLDVWTKNREENDNIVRELVFYLHNHPTMMVDIPYASEEQHVFNVFIDPDIEDNSDIIDHINRGEYFRQTLSIYTDDAYYWKTSTRPGYELGIEFIYEDEVDKIEPEEKGDN